MAAPAAKRLEVLHGLWLQGLATTEALAERAGVTAERCRDELVAAAAHELVLRRDGRMPGWMLTPAGRAEAAKLLADELDSAGVRATIEDAYRRFLEVNNDFLGLCTSWQMVDEHTLNDHGNAEYDARIVGLLGALDGRVQPVCRDLAEALERFSRYGARLASARARVEQGEPEWFTKPMIASYHTIWFELHEDLLATLGIERSKEAG